MLYPSALGVNQDAPLPAETVDVAAGVHHEAWCATGPCLDRPVVMVAEAAGCNHGAETLGIGCCVELDTGRCPPARAGFLSTVFLTRVALVRCTVLDAGRCLPCNMERSAGAVSLSGQSLGWSGCPGVAHATILRPRARGYAPDSLSLLTMPVCFTFPSDPIFFVTRGVWAPSGHWHRAATPRIHLPMARNR